MEDGIEVEFSLITFIPDSVTLESAWDDLSDDERSLIMAGLVAAMGKLYSLNCNNEQVQLLLKGSKFVLERVNHSCLPPPLLPLVSPWAGSTLDVPRTRLISCGCS